MAVVVYESCDHTAQSQETLRKELIEKKKRWNGRATEISKGMKKGGIEEGIKVIQNEGIEWTKGDKDKAESED